MLLSWFVLQFQFYSKLEPLEDFTIADQGKQLGTDNLEEIGRDAPAQKKQMVNRGSKRPDKSMRYAIETRSEVDVVDDGFRWRKYGQKPVKNSAHPRYIFFSHLQLSSAYILSSAQLPGEAVIIISQFSIPRH